MIQEEKAKAYDEALERAKNLHKDAIDMGENIRAKQCEIIFHELAESEDERIRKEIMDFIDTKTIDSDERRNRWFSYLEKYKPISFTSLEDTKVKMSLMQYISELNQDVVHLHPGIETCNEWIAWLENIPYTIDHEKREGFHLGYKAALEKQGKQKSDWSEGDKDYYDAIIAKLEVTQDDAALTDNQMEFLKSLKDRVQPKQEWSKEDDSIVESILFWLKSVLNVGCYPRYKHWLKSIKQRIEG